MPLCTLYLLKCICGLAGGGVEGLNLSISLHYALLISSNASMDSQEEEDSKQVVILHSDVVGVVVYLIQSLDFDDELKGLFFKFDVSNILKCLYALSISSNAFVNWPEEE